MTYADRIPAPRPVPTTRDRLRPTPHLDAIKAERDEALEARDVLRQKLDKVTADRNRMISIVDAVVNAVRDSAERLDQALAAYDTAPEVTPVEPEQADCPHLAAIMAGQVYDADSDSACGWCNDLRKKRQETATTSLGSVSPHAQDDRPTAGELARLFHDTYEELAPVYGYRTRQESAKPWAEVPQQNRALMIATCARVMTALFASTTSALPAWVLDLVRGLDRYELEHPKLLNANTNTEWPCPAPLLALVPAEVRRQAEVGDREPHESEQALRDRIEHAIRARLADAWPHWDDVFHDQVAAVAAVAAVNELRQG